MKSNIFYKIMNRGSATTDLWWFIGIMIALGIVWFATGGPNHPEAWRGPFIEPPAPLGSGQIYSTDRGASSAGGGSTNVDYYQDNGASAIPVSSRSPWYGQVSLYQGNAAYEIGSGKEYIELTAQYSNDSPINITGWRLANSPLRHNPTSVGVIPQAVKLFTSTGAGTLTPVILQPGDRVVVVSGQPLNRSNWPLRQSFQLNKCVGYLDEEFETSNITPPLLSQCPRPSEEPGVNNLVNKCYDFVRYLSSCHEPEFKEDRDGVERVDGQIDNLDRNCENYIKEHFNYAGCVKWHAADADFYGNEWRVYLGQNWEMWAENRETITLYDQLGKIVAQESY